VCELVLDFKVLFPINLSERLINGIAQMKQILAAKITSPGAEKTGEELSQHLDKIVKNATSKCKKTDLRSNFEFNCLV
jgi:hypothetical protein